jgi:hypothetical protein
VWFAGGGPRGRCAVEYDAYPRNPAFEVGQRFFGDRDYVYTVGHAEDCPGLVEEQLGEVRVDDAVDLVDSDQQLAAVAMALVPP